jgi:hypothetical protein
MATAPVSTVVGFRDILLCHWWKGIQVALISTHSIGPDQKQRIIDELNRRGANQPCPRCGQNQFALTDGYISHPLTNQTSGPFVIGGPAVPTIGVVCTNCGYLSEHAIGVLGLLKGEGEQR